MWDIRSEQYTIIFAFTSNQKTGRTPAPPKINRDNYMKWAVFYFYTFVICFALWTMNQQHFIAADSSNLLSFCTSDALPLWLSDRLWWTNVLWIAAKRRFMIRIHWMVFGVNLIRLGGFPMVAFGIGNRGLPPGFHCFPLLDNWLIINHPTWLECW